MKSRITFLIVFATATALMANTYTVTNTNDTLTAGTLRQAITDANAHSNTLNAGSAPDRIEFNIAGNGPHTISPGSALPTITDPVVIDGYTQGDSTGATTDDAVENTNATGGLNTVLKIELNGTNAGNGVNGLRISAGASTVKGLVINRFTAQGIYLQTTGGNSIQGNFIGTNVAGTAKSQNGFSGVYMDSPNNTIGGTTAAARNLSSGNFFHDVEISDAAATGNHVQGNLLGTNAAGAASLTGTDSFGVFINNGASSNIIGGTSTGARNVISGNVNTGVYLRDTSLNQIQGNYIGINAAGTAARGNGGTGVSLDNSSNNTIGGTTAGAGNIISGNGDTGIAIFGGGGQNTIQGNYIGTNLAGTGAIANEGGGVSLEDSPDNLIGGSVSGAGNLISGNDFTGVFITGAQSQDNQISGNIIGRNVTNSANVPNANHGVELKSSGPNIIGGGFNAANANIIAGNGGTGVTVIFGTGPCIKKGIISNSIFSNGGLGIDLGNDGVTGNDTGDGDTGPNTLQNFPVLTNASTDATSTTIEGTLNSTANTSFHIEFFSNVAADPSGFGEGQTFLGYKDVTTGNDGNVSFTAVLPVLPPSGQSIITATTSDNAELANTSEFSNAIAISGGPTPTPTVTPTPSPSATPRHHHRNEDQRDRRRQRHGHRHLAE
jgi:parallel beta-helix repeat protein